MINLTVLKTKLVNYKYAFYFIGFLILLLIPGLLFILLGSIVKTVLLVGIISAIVFTFLAIKNKNNSKSTFYLPKEFSLVKKAFVVSIWAISIVGLIMFFYIFQGPEVTQWGQVMHGQP